MRGRLKWLPLLVLLGLAALPAKPQSNIFNTWQFVTSSPAGNACSQNQAWVYMPSGLLYTCQYGTVTLYAQGGSSGGGGAVTQLSAGTNITLNPTSGLGSVTINSTDCLSGSSAANCSPYQQTITQSSGNLVATLGSSVLDQINVTALSASVTSFTISNPSNGELVQIYDCQAASGGPYTIASPAGWPTIPVHPLASACLLATYQYYNSSNIQLVSVIPQGTAPGVCFSQTIVGTNPPSGDYYDGCTSTQPHYWLDSNGKVYQPVNLTGGLPPAALGPGTVTTLTDGSTVTWAIGSVLNQDAALLFTVHSGSRTLNITNPVIGGNYVVKLTQDGTGGEGLTLGTGCTWKVANGGSGAVTLSTGAGALDVLTFIYDGTNCLASLLKNLN